MNNRAPQKIEDIYPLTIIAMRYGGRFVIFNCEEDADFVASVQGDEEVSYGTEEWMEKNASFVVYGIGADLYSAFEDYKERLKNSYRI